MAAGSASRWLGAAAAAAAVRSRGPRDGRLPLVWIVRGLGAAPGPAARRLLQPGAGPQHAGERGGDAGPRCRWYGLLHGPSALLRSVLPQGRSAFPPPPSTAARPVARRTTTRCWECRAPPPRRRSRRRTTRHGTAAAAPQHCAMTAALPGCRVLGFAPRALDEIDPVSNASFFSFSWQRNTIRTQTRTTLKLRRSLLSWQKPTR